jgi:lactate dehydrogenase-like 2-hydroxyacid dehydrogenase
MFQFGAISKAICIMHYTIVALEGIHTAIPEFDVPAPHTSTQTVHLRTSPQELRSRVHDATIIVCTTVKLTAEILDPAVTPNLQLVAVLASGTDHVDLEACKKRGITVCNTPGVMVDSVAEHSLALYFATRRSVPLMHRKTVGSSEWLDKGSMTSYMRTGDGQAPATCDEEICGIVGYGKIGERLFTLIAGAEWLVTLLDVEYHLPLITRLTMCRSSNCPSHKCVGHEGPDCGSKIDKRVCCR